MWLESREPRENPNEQLWRKEQEQVDKIVDKLSKPVDPGIKESVVALRVSGLSTNASCEGHLDKRIKAPWVDIGHVPPDVKQQLTEAWKADREGKPVGEAVQKLRLETWERIRAEHVRLLELLDEFYRDRQVPFHRRLIIKFYPDSARLLSQGAEIQDAYAPEIQQEKLREYQDEVSAFARFLKDRFFSQS